jgi:hypothetical protein
MKNNWLIIYCFMSCSWIFHWYGDVKFDREGLQNIGLCSVEGSLLCHTCCNTGPWFFWSHQKDRLIQSPFMTHKGMWRIYSNQDHHRSSFSRLLPHTRGCRGPILTRILTGLRNNAITLEIHCQNISAYITWNRCSLLYECGLSIIFFQN